MAFGLRGFAAFGLGVRPKGATAGGGGGGPSVPIPANNKMIIFGDSRANAFLGLSSGVQFMRGDGFPPNIAALDPRWQMAADYTNAGGTVLRGNYGISGQHLTNYVASLTARSSGPEKSYGYAATDPAAVILLFGDVNYFKPGGTDVASQITLLNIFIAYVTNPANCGGLQKIVVIIDETPIGINLSGAAANGMTTTAAAAAMRTYAAAVRALDYRQPGGNPNVVVVPAYEDFLDAATGTNLYNKVGYSNDGTHQSTISSMILAKKCVAELDPIADAMGLTDQVTPLLPTAATASTFINSNPMMTGTGGTITGAGTTLGAGAVPTGWAWTTGSGSITSQVINVSTFTDEDGENGIEISATWSGASGYSGLLRQLVTSSELSSKGITPGDLLRAVARVKHMTGSVSFAGAGLEVQTRSTGGSGGNRTWSSVPSSNKGALAGYGGAEAGGDQLWLEAPIIDTGHVDDGGGVWASTNGIIIGFRIAYLDAAGSFTIRIGRCGVIKIP